MAILPTSQNWPKKEKEKTTQERVVLKFFQWTKEEENKFGSNYKILVFEQFEQMKQFPFTHWKVSGTMRSWQSPTIGIVIVLN
jgi:hypothetical protein